MIWRHHQRRSIHWFLSNPLWRCWLLSLRCFDFQMFSVDLDEAGLVQWLKVISILFLFGCVLNCLVHVFVAKKHQKTWKFIHCGVLSELKLPEKSPSQSGELRHPWFSRSSFCNTNNTDYLSKGLVIKADKNLGDLPQLGVLEFHQNEDRSSHQGKRGANEVFSIMTKGTRAHMYLKIQLWDIGQTWSECE